MKKLILLFLLPIGVALAQPSQPVFRRGAALPTVCATGDVFYKTAATAGQYNCIATNTWSIVTGSGGVGTVTLVTGTANEITVVNGTTTPVTSIAAAFDISGHTSTAPIKKGTTLPATCTVGQFYDKTDATAGQNLFSCTSTNAWTVITGSATPASPANSIQFNNAGAFGGSTAATINISTSTDGPNLISVNGNLLSMDSVSSATGLAGSHIDLGAAVGGNTTIATTGTGGEGGDFFISSNNGGLAPNALTASTGGRGGDVITTTGQGGTVNVMGMGTNTGGRGGNVDFYPIGGGSALNGNINNGGNAGAFRIFLDVGGSGSTANGTDGFFSINGAATVFTIQYDGSVLATTLKTTGAATGKKVVCVDTTTGKLYASSTGTDCSN